MSEKIILKNVRLSYAHIFRPSAIADDAPKKYSVTAIIPKSEEAQLRAVKTALATAAEARFPGRIKPEKPWPATLHCPLKDGDTLADEHPEYANAYILRAASDRRPVVLDRHCAALTEEDGLLYSGCYANLSLAAAAFDVSAKKGVTVYLNGVQFVRDGERLSGHDAANDFEDLDEDGRFEGDPDGACLDEDDLPF